MRQMVSDAHGNFCHVSVGWGGAARDDVILATSALARRAESGEIFGLPAISSGYILESIWDSLTPYSSHYDLSVQYAKFKYN